MKETVKAKPARKLSFKSRFLRNPIDERLNKITLLKAALDKKQSKELLSLLGKHYYTPKIKKPEHNNNESEPNLKQLIEERKNQLNIDWSFRKILKREAVKGKIPAELRKDIWMMASGARSKML